jgi:glycosidase
MKSVIRRFFCAASIALLPFALFAAPEVYKCDPPSWWAGHSIHPVRLLIKGTNLSGAQLSLPRGFRAKNQKINATGTYLFADLEISRNTRPGEYEFETVSQGAHAPFKFTILPKLPRQNAFQGFSSDDVLYLIMPDRFVDGDSSNNDPPGSPGLFDRSKGRYYHGGDLKGVRSKLPYLKDLGVTAIWLTPWYDNVNHLNRKETYDNQPITDYHGYGAIDFYGVEEHLGTLRELQELVAAAHELGLKVIQDQVANHTGPYHPWVKDSPTPTWYHGTEQHHLANTWQTWTIPDPHASTDLQRSTLEGWFIDILPDLNQEDPECSRYLIQNAVWWVGMTGVDGVRQDTLPYVGRRFWADWSGALKKEFPKLVLLGEMFDGDAAKVAFFQGGVPRHDGIDSGIDALFDFHLFYQIRKAFGEGKSIRDVANGLAYDRLYQDPNRLVTFAGLHDVARFMNERGATPAGLELAFTFIATTRGIPLIYYGDEIAMPGAGDPDNRRDFPGGFSGDSANSFERSGRSAGQEEVFSTLRKALAARRELEPLRHGKLTSLTVTDQFFAFARCTKNQCVLVAINNDSKPNTADVDLDSIPCGNATWSDRFGSARVVSQAGKRLRIELPARSAAILTQ